MAAAIGSEAATRLLVEGRANEPDGMLKQLQKWDGELYEEVKPHRVLRGRALYARIQVRAADDHHGRARAPRAGAPLLFECPHPRPPSAFAPDFPRADDRPQRLHRSFSRAFTKVAAGVGVE